MNEVLKQLEYELNRMLADKSTKPCIPYKVGYCEALERAIAIVKEAIK